MFINAAPVFTFFRMVCQKNQQKRKKHNNLKALYSFLQEETIKGESIVWGQAENV